LRHAVIAVVVLALAGSASAGGPSKQVLEQAKEHFKAGKAAQDAGRYEDAAREYRAAYELSQIPDLLFNLGQAYRLAGDARTAVDFYRKYLDAAPGGRGAADAQAFIVTLSRELEAEDAAARKKAEAEAAAARKKAEAEAAARKKAEDEAARRAAARPAKDDTRTTTTTRRKPGAGRGLRIAGLVTAGGGVVLTGVGVYFALRSQSLSDQQGGTFDPELIDEGKAANRNAYLFTGVGAAAVIGGGVLWYLGHRAGKQTEVIVTPTSAALSYTTTF